MSAVNASAAQVAVTSAAPSFHDDIAQLQHKIAELEEEIKQAKREGDREMVKLLLKKETALQEKENLLLKAQSDAGLFCSQAEAVRHLQSGATLDHSNCLLTLLPFDDSLSLLACFQRHPGQVTPPVTRHC